MRTPHLGCRGQSCWRFVRGPGPPPHPRLPAPPAPQAVGAPPVCTVPGNTSGTHTQRHAPGAHRDTHPPNPRNHTPEGMPVHTQRTVRSTKRTAQEGGRAYGGSVGGRVGGWVGGWVGGRVRAYLGCAASTARRPISHFCLARALCTHTRARQHRHGDDTHTCTPRTKAWFFLPSPSPHTQPHTNIPPPTHSVTHMWASSRLTRLVSQHRKLPPRVPPPVRRTGA